MKHYWIILVLVAFVSCEKKKTAEEALISTTFEAERQFFFNQIKNPDEVATIIQATGTVFQPTLINDPNYYSSYTSQEVKAAANLGIYLGDLNYSIAYGESTYTQSLFTAAHELSKVVGIEQRVLAFLMARYNQNLEQKDSIKAIVTDLFEGATTGLQGTEREKFVGIVMAGYQIENLHLALGIIQNGAQGAAQNPATAISSIKQLVLNQQQPVETTYQFLRSIADPTNPEKNPNLAYYSTAFEELIAVFKGIKSQPVDTTQPAEILTESQVVALQEKISAIRIKVIGL